MIEQSIISYLVSLPAIQTLVGNKVYYHRAASDAKMPYVVISTIGGTRPWITQVVKEGDYSIRVFVDDDKQFRGREIADAVITALEDFRGDMLPARDVFITCEAITDLDGANGAFRYAITFRVRFIAVQP